MLEYSYLIALTGAFLIALYMLLLYAPKSKKKKQIVNEYDTMVKPFTKNFYNDLYTISFKFPFASFMPESSKDKKAIELNHKIALAGYSEQMDFRVLSTLQISLFFLAIVVTLLFGFLLNTSLGFWCALFNLNAKDISPTTAFLVIGCVTMLLALVPKMRINSKAKNKEAGFVKDLPVLQIFLIGMLQSNRSISEIIYTLGTAETPYRDIFSNGYRIYTRDREAGFDYLITAFNGTAFKDSIIALSTGASYARDETVKVLRGRMGLLEEEVMAIKRKKNGLKSMISEGSIVLPFATLFLLGVTPLIMWGFSNMTKAMNF
ncbi:MAG: hypothetical protein RSC93_04295 [Erysipelotrichaceae bacterium]